MDKLPIEYQEYLKRWNQLDGRSTVREFWIPVLVNFVVAILFGIIGAIVGTNILGSLFGLAVLIPNITVMVRRLHDTGKSGWYYWWVLLPLVGWIILLLALIKDSE